ncbi:alpha-hydroxy acid oxidase [Nonomuraea africana]|uniref:Isopentenyl diphosphate isomerase/L-lactate dehydrogenase-like FMN-dependent dehydrogenase n=1 Tax=Nonomuraea africana TaxID=46171 RepID=A0ABR9KEM8_9ACTN|nr:alpha-hydroxy acid oxidase [Nonomuraea africana]MBE1560483.1 isopentenyl diphosphate isomerase/L-lactate dehydrogenase-like FMN-dependent dehydrogenase [Nonomuraea africana]
MTTSALGQEPSVALRTEDFAVLAQARLEPAVWDFLSGGSGAERTLAGNLRAFDAVRLRPRILTGTAEPDTGVELFAHRWPVPFAIAPVACNRLLHPEGEVATVRGAGALGAVTIVPMLASRTLEDIRAAAGAPLWLQLFWTRDRALMTELVERAESAGYGALVITSDMPVMARRLRDLRNRFVIEPEFGPVNLGSAGVQVRGGEGESGVRAHAAKTFDPTATWRDLEWLRSTTRLPVIVKGVLTDRDAELAVRHGAQGVVVSNHGGRQLDGAQSSLTALREVTRALGGRVPVFVDGGVRRGVDVLVALAAGADAVLLGRAPMWGLAAAGERGVREVLALILEELREAMRLCGAATTADLGPDLLSWSAP